MLHYTSVKMSMEQRHTRRGAHQQLIWTIWESSWKSHSLYFSPIRIPTNHAYFTWIGSFPDRRAGLVCVANRNPRTLSSLPNPRSGGGACRNTGGETMPHSTRRSRSNRENGSPHHPHSGKYPLKTYFHCDKISFLDVRWVRVEMNGFLWEIFKWIEWVFAE